MLLLIAKVFVVIGTVSAIVTDDNVIFDESIFVVNIML